MTTPHRLPKHTLLSLNQVIDNLTMYRINNPKYIYIGFPDSSHTLTELGQILDTHLSPIVQRNVNDTSSFNGYSWTFYYSSFTVPDEKLKTFIEAAVKIKSYIYVRKSMLTEKLNNAGMLANQDSDFYSLEDFYAYPVEIQKIIL